MKDISTNRPLSVDTDGGVGPYIMVSLDQVADVVRVLKKNNVWLEVQDGAVSIDDEPYVAVVNLGRKGDARLVQEILDGVP